MRCPELQCAEVVLARPDAHRHRVALRRQHLQLGAATRCALILAPVEHFALLAEVALVGHGVEDDVAGDGGEVGLGVARGDGELALHLGDVDVEAAHADLELRLLGGLRERVALEVQQGLVEFELRLLGAEARDHVAGLHRAAVGHHPHQLALRPVLPRHDELRGLRGLEFARGFDPEVERRGLQHLQRRGRLRRVAAGTQGGEDGQ